MSAWSTPLATAIALSCAEQSAGLPSLSEVNRLYSTFVTGIATGDSAAIASSLHTSVRSGFTRRALDEWRRSGEDRPVARVLGLCRVSSDPPVVSGPVNDGEGGPVTVALG